MYWVQMRGVISFFTRLMYSVCPSLRMISFSEELAQNVIDVTAADAIP